MAIDEKILQQERKQLKTDFDTLSSKVTQVEKDLGSMKGNLNAVYGAIQQVDKLIELDKGSTKEKKPEEKELLMEDRVIKDTEKKLYNLYEGRKIKRKGK